jgi:hypothetical protein
MSRKINETTFNPNSWCIISLEMNPKILWKWTITKCVYCCLLASREFEITPHFWTHIMLKKTFGKSMIHLMRLAWFLPLGVKRKFKMANIRALGFSILQISSFIFFKKKSHHILYQVPLDSWQQYRSMLNFFLLSYFVYSQN